MCEVLRDRRCGVAEHVGDDLGASRRDLLASLGGASVGSVDTQVAHSARHTGQDRRSADHRERPSLQIRSGPPVATHLSAHDDIGKRPSVTVDEGPQPAQQQGDGVQQMRDVADQQSPRPHPLAVAIDDGDSEYAAAQAPPGERRHQQAVDGHREDQHSTADYAGPRQRPALRRRPAD